MRNAQTLPPAVAALDGGAVVALATRHAYAIFQHNGATYYTRGGGERWRREDWRGPFEDAPAAARAALLGLDAIARAESLGVELFRSFGAACWAPRGVAVSGNVTGAGWRTGFRFVEDAAADALDRLDPNRTESKPWAPVDLPADALADYADSVEEMAEGLAPPVAPKARDLANLLNRAAAALETPADLDADARAELIEDLTVAARALAR